MVTIGLLWALTRADGQKISVDIEATTATNALRQVGAAANLTLTTSPQTANDVLLLRFKDVPVEEAMRRIAAADDASWKQEGDSYRLIRTSDEQRAEEAKELKEDAENIKEEIAKKVAALDKLPAWSSDQADQLAMKVAAHLKTFNPQSLGGNWYETSTQLSDQAPFGRAVTRVMATFDPKVLAQMPVGLKSVWSTSPTAIQYPMPQPALPVINQFLSENADWSAAVDKYHLKAPTFGNTTYWVGGFGDFSTSHATASSVAVVLLSATRYGGYSGIQIDLAAYDNKGKKVADTQESLDSPRFAALTEKPKIPPGEPTITLTGDAKIIADGVKNRGRGAAQKLPPDVVARIVDVAHHDPLGLFVGSTLRQAAEIKGINLAAHLSDQMGLAGYFANNQAMTVDQFLQYLSVVGGRSEIKDGWLMIQPSRPVEARTLQADRKELGKYLSLCAASSHLSLDEQAAFAVSLPDPEENSLPSVMAGIINPGSNPNQYDHNMLKLYGLMTTDQKSAMIGGGYPCGSLTDEEKDCLDRMVYGRYTSLQYQPPARRNGDGGNVDWDLYNNGIYHEPTESMPSGIPPKALIKLQDNTSYVVVTADTIKPQYTQQGRELDAQSLAWQKYCQEHLDLFPWMADTNQQLNLGSLRYGKRREMSFTFQFTPELSMNQRLEDKDIDSFQAVTLQDLPTDFKKQFQDMYDSYVKSYADVKPGQFSGPSRNANIPP